METSFINDITDISWAPCYIGTQKFIVKFIFKENSYAMMLSDLKNVYYEEMCDKSLLIRSKELNSNMEILPHKIVGQLQRMAQNYINCSHTTDDKLILLKKDSTMVVLKSESMLSSIPFVWHYNLVVMEISSYYLYVVQPLIGVISELRRRSHELIKIIKQKDEEIHQNRNTSTSNFKEEVFTKEMDRTINVTDDTTKIINSLFCDQLFSKVESAFQSLSVPSCCTSMNEPSSKKLCSDLNNHTESSSTVIKSVAEEMEEEISRRQQLQEQLDKKQKLLKKKKPIKF